MDDLPINIVDIAVLAIVLLSAAIAFVRGCVHEVLAIGAWVGAALATIYGFGHVQPYARKVIAIDLLADIIAGVIVFVAVLVLLSLLTRMLSSRVRGSSLGALDRTLGLVFGLARGGVIVAAAWLVLTWALPTPAERPAYLQEAKSRRLVELSANALESLLPETLRREGRDAIDAAKQGATDAQRAKEAYDAFSQPRVEGSDGRSEPGYNEQERGDMDRITDTVTSDE